MQHYGKAVVVFDGYDNGWATLTWRTREQMTEIHFMGSTIMNVKKDALLSNKKKNFITLLGRILEQVVAKPAMPEVMLMCVYFKQQFKVHQLPIQCLLVMILTC